jgi:ATP-binding cassette subfamily B protein
MKQYASIRAFITYSGKFKAAFWGTAAAFAVSDIAISLIPWLIGRLTDSLAASNDIVFWTAMVILASIGHDMLWRASEFLYLGLILPKSQRIDDHLFAAVLQHPYSYFVDKFTGKVSSYVNSLGRGFRELMDNFHYQYVNLVVALPIIAATMFTVNVPTGMIFVASVFLMFVTGRPLAKIMAAAERKQADERSTMDGYVVDAIANFVSVKAFANERAETKRLYNKRESLIKAAKSSYFKSILFWGLMSLFVRWIIWPSTFVLNIYLYAQGQLDLAQMTTFLAAIVLFSNFIWDIIWNISQLNIKLANTEEAYQYLFGSHNIFKETLAQGVEPLPPEAFKHSLELRDVSFAYPDKPNVEIVRDINLNIRHGEKIGLVGHSGGGKSTLTKLLLGYYPIVKGQLLLDGRPVDNRALGKLTSYVPQDTAVFHRPIRENIAYGRQDATEAEVVAAAKHAQAHDFITELEDGYDTLVGERGIKLSGGQRQRIAIARAILKDAPLLMLDEATSALDSESEKLIQTALWELIRGRTAIVIAHRLSTIQKMDRILVLENGTIVEEGTHHELLSKRGVYAKLWAHQSGGFIEE